MNMKAPEITIGYVPYSDDLSHADDRRRFPYYARRHNVPYEIADARKAYDVILLPAPSNLTKWWLYRKKHPKTVFVFEMVDSLIHQSDLFNTVAKGVGRFLIGKEDRPVLNHKKFLMKWLRAADIVVCSNPVTKETIREMNKEVWFSLDYLEHEYHFLKQDYHIDKKMKLFWEGQGVVLPQLLHFKSVFERVSSFCELHVVTSGKFPKYGPFISQDTKFFLKQLPIDTHFHLWDNEKNGELIAGFDCGIIPISRSDAYAWHKPANKLVSFWLSGVPALASDTPAYKDLTTGFEYEVLCSDLDEWISRITQIFEMAPEERKAIAEAQYKRAIERSSNKLHDEFWRGLLERGREIRGERSVY